MINVIRKEVFAVEELQICMKQVRVDVEVVIFLERLHANRTASFSLAEPLVNAVVVKCMNT